METEMELSVGDVCQAIEILANEVRARIKHGDGHVESLQRVIEALEDADRILITK